jgi:hypothetical protein
MHSDPALYLLFRDNRSLPSLSISHRRDWERVSEAIAGGVSNDHSLFAIQQQARGTDAAGRKTTIYCPASGISGPHYTRDEVVRARLIKFQQEGDLFSRAQLVRR